MVTMYDVDTPVTSDSDVHPRRRRRAPSPPPPDGRRSSSSLSFRRSEKSEKKGEKKRRNKKPSSSPPSQSSSDFGSSSSSYVDQGNHANGEAIDAHMQPGRDKVLGFIQQFDAAFGDENFSETSKLRHVAMHLQKSARQWWASLRSKGEAPKTWKLCRVVILKQFLSHGASNQVLTAWRSLKLEGGENIQSYVDKFWNLHLKGGVYKRINFSEQKQQFCAGLLKNAESMSTRNALGLYRSYGMPGANMGMAGSSQPYAQNMNMTSRAGGNFSSKMPLLNAPAYDNLTPEGKPKDEDRFKTHRKEPQGKQFSAKGNVTTKLMVPPFKKKPFTQSKPFTRNRPLTGYRPLTPNKQFRPPPFSGQRQGLMRHFTSKTFDERRALRDAKNALFVKDTLQMNAHKGIHRIRMASMIAKKRSQSLVQDLYQIWWVISKMRMPRNCTELGEKLRDKEVLVFFDPRSHANFISPKLASKLGICAEEMGTTGEAGLACPGHSEPVTPILGKLRLHNQSYVDAENSISCRYKIVMCCWVFYGATRDIFLRT
ncbi:hypothetical protein L7F22_023942 [Adiantum nelumboides]|nr:hypothetical protein [Adiantum nelumboides]